MRGRCSSVGGRISVLSDRGSLGHNLPSRPYQRHRSWDSFGVAGGNIMKLPRRRFLRLVSAATVVMPRVARAQVWPTRIVQLLVGFPPGGGMDSAGRIVASRLSEIWGQQVVIENKPGAGGRSEEHTSE